MKWKLLMSVMLLTLPTAVLSQEWNMGTVQKDINGLKKKDSDFEQRLSALEKRLNNWDFGTSQGLEQCPCPQGGKCICPPDECDCEDCPIHKKKGDVVPSGLENQDGVEYYGVSWKGNYPTFKGEEVLYFGADWCANCPAAIKRLGDLTKEIVYIDCTEKGGKGDTLAGMYNIDAYPAMLHIEDSHKVGSHQTEGDSVGSYLAGLWLGKTPSNRVQSSSVVRSSIRSYHPRQSTVRIVRSRPSYSSGGKSLNLTRMPGPSWTNPGDLRSHLINEHGYSPAQINGLSYSQLNILKDNDHNSWGHGGHPYAGMRRSIPYSSSYSRSRSYSSPYRPITYFSSGGCPGGMCPR